MYYSLQVIRDTQAKDDALAALEGTDFNSMFGFEEWDNQGDKEMPKCLMVRTFVWAVLNPNSEK